MTPVSSGRASLVRYAAAVAAAAVVVTVVTVVASTRAWWGCPAWTTAGDDVRVRVGVLAGPTSSEANIRRIKAAVSTGCGLAAETVTPENLRTRGVVHDVLLVPGGVAKGVHDALGAEGREAIKEHVARGGGYVGICAGAFLASADEGRGLGLIDATTLDGTYDIPGWGEVAAGPRKAGDVTLEMTEEGSAVFPEAGRSLVAAFRGGPIFPDAERLAAANGKVLAVYGSETWSFDAQRGSMIRTPAIVAATYGAGRVMIFGPHVEESAAADAMLRRAVREVAPRDVPSREAAPREAAPREAAPRADRAKDGPGGRSEAARDKRRERSETPETKTRGG